MKMRYMSKCIIIAIIGLIIFYIGVFTWHFYVLLCDVLNSGREILLR